MSRRPASAIITPLTAAALALLAPAAASACGGLFCDNTQPVNQAAERLLFAHDDDGRLHMHVRITYQGPPAEFGWLLPTAPDVEVGLSSEQLFSDLDNRLAPRFILQTEFEEGCEQLLFEGAAGQGGEGGGFADAGAAPPPMNADGGVQVLSREAVGAFDIATLLVESVDDLRRWLDENGYQIPERTDALLTPYVEMGAAFVAVKLLPDRESGDVSPLRLSFSADRPAIPIVPTAVAAEPDMGIIVHVLDQHRAIPLNYRHVVINEAALDWQGAGSNYPAVVSQAADEADGRAFATDYAGEAGDAPRPYTEAQLEAVAAAQSWEDLWNALNLWDAAFRPLDADLQRVLPTGLIVPEDPGFLAYVGCPECYPDTEVIIDGGALAAALEDEVNAPRVELERLFDRNRYLTRLYSTMSAAEMTIDPEFGVNPDLGDVPNRRTAIQRVSCPDDEPDFANAVIETPGGVRFQLVDGENPNIIRRQSGATIRGLGVPGAQRVERTVEAGPSEVISDRTDEILGMNPVLIMGPAGCACDAGDSSGATGFATLALVALLGLRRRRR